MSDTILTWALDALLISILLLLTVAVFFMIAMGIKAGWKELMAKDKQEAKPMPFSKALNKELKQVIKRGGIYGKNKKFS